MSGWGPVGGKRYFGKLVRRDPFQRGFQISGDEDVLVFLAQGAATLMESFTACAEVEKAKSESLSSTCSFSIDFSSKESM